MLTGKTIRGVGWSVGARLGSRVIDFVTLLVLARFLQPADFGVMALATSVIMIVETALEISLAQVLTRLPVIEKPHLDTAFTLGLIRGLILACIVAAMGWPIALAYEDNRLVLLIFALAIAPFARGLYSPGMVRFTRSLNFQQAFIGTLSGKVLAMALGLVVLALNGGYWAIATTAIASAVGPTVISYFQAQYVPRLSLSEMRYFVNFLGWFSLAQLISAVNWQIDRILLGFFLSRADLGRYTMASDLAVLPTQSLIGPAMQPVMAAFSTIQSDPDRLRRAYLKAEHYTMMLAMPACLHLAISADLIVRVLLGPQWLDAAPYLRWTALASILAAYVQPLYAVIVTKDRVHWLFQMNGIELLLKLVLFPATVLWSGIFGVIAARAGIGLIMFVVCLAVAKRVVGVSVLSQMSNLRMPAGATFVFAAVLAISMQILAPLGLQPLLELSIVTLAAGLAYLTLLVLLGVPLKQLVRLNG